MRLTNIQGLPENTPRRRGQAHFAPKASQIEPDPNGSHRRPLLWVVSELYYPEETSTGYILTKLAEGLAERHDVRVVCGQPTYSARGVRAAWRETRHGVAIERCRGTTFNKDRLLPRIVNLLTLCCAIFWRLTRGLRRGDRVLVVTNPPLLPFVASWACRLRGARCLLLIHDVYPEVAVAAGLLEAESRLTRMAQSAVRRLYGRMQRIIVLGRDMHALVLRKLGPEAAKKLAIIPNWADLELVTPAASAGNALLREQGLDGRFVIQYAGNMGRSHNLEALPAAAMQLRDEPNVHFLCLGSGAKKACLESSVRAAGLNNFTILNPRPRSESQVFLNACDVALISFVPGMAGISVPSRLYNVLAAGKPILAVADEDSELARVVREERVGWVVPPDDPAALARAIRAAMRDPAERAEMGIRARRAAEQKYTLRQILEAYARLLAEAGDSSPRITRHSLRNTPLEEATLWH